MYSVLNVQLQNVLLLYYEPRFLIISGIWLNHENVYTWLFSSEMLYHGAAGENAKLRHYTWQSCL